MFYRERERVRQGKDRECESREQRGIVKGRERVVVSAYRMSKAARDINRMASRSCERTKK